jgi:hypothetical protein
MSNPVRTCIGCAQTDDHPRHVIATSDGANVSWHLDCHVIAGKCEVCTGQLADAPAGVTGDALRAYLLTTGPAPNQPGWTAPVLEAEA